MWMLNCGNGAIWNPSVLPYGEINCVTCKCKVQENFEITMEIKSDIFHKNRVWRYQLTKYLFYRMGKMIAVEKLVLLLVAVTKFKIKTLVALDAL